MGDDTVRLVTSDGVTLEAERVVPDAPVGAVVLTHPHPLQGGSMHSLVTSELFRLLPEHGLAVLRFNFRGVEGSEGTHDGGRAEQLDVVAAIDALVEATSDAYSGSAMDASRPFVLAGWSFGADVALTVLDDRLTGWFLIAPPLRVLPREAFVAGGDPRPKLLAVPEHDPFCPPEAAAEATADWANTRVEVVKGADHFLVGRTTKAADLLVDFVAGLA